MATPSQPSVPLTSGTYAWSTIPNSELFSASGPSPTDVLQASVGDCTLLSEWASIAEQDPNFIKSAIKQVGVTSDGHNVYAVNFFNYLNSDPTAVEVDDTLVTVGSSFPYDAFVVQQNDVKILWPSIMQKAFAKYRGGYSLASGATFDELTGVTSVGDTSSNAVPFLSLVNSGYAVAAITVTQPTDVTSSQYFLPGAQQIGQYVCDDETAAPVLGNWCVVSDHEYSVLAFDGTQVTIRNPWGTNQGSGSSPSLPPGEIVMPLKEFQGLFTSVWADSIVKK